MSGWLELLLDLLQYFCGKKIITIYNIGKDDLSGCFVALFKLNFAD